VRRRSRHDDDHDDHDDHDHDHDDGIDNNACRRCSCRRHCPPQGIDGAMGGGGELDLLPRLTRTLPPSPPRPLLPLPTSTAAAAGTTPTSSHRC
jgi:hypothetical protein